MSAALALVFLVAAVDDGPWAAAHAVLAEHCFACHAGEQRKGGLALDTAAGWQRGGVSGSVLDAEHPEASLALARVTAEDDLDRMPPKGRRLTDDEVAALRTWIRAGAEWPAGHTTGAAIAPLALREVTPRRAGLNTVDAFGPEPAGPVADDATFMRRVHLDLVGLLPEPEAVAAFCADPAPEKRGRLVASLLADDRAYAEHWMSFWNDHLRNDFQGTGYIDGGRSQITAWLYNALLRDEPYDRFVRELIAPTSSASEGFIRGIVWRGDNTVVQQPPMQAAIHVSQVFLGVNLKCAACHDSFVNDWSLAGTFALANSFSEAPLSLVRCETDLGVAAGYGFLWPELGTVDGSATLAERRASIADMVTTSANGYFARCIVNRLWARLFGRGLVEPLDEMEREGIDPVLLDALAHRFVASGYKLRDLLFVLTTSQLYQRAACVDEDSAGYRAPAVKRMSAEQFYDALAHVTGAGPESPAYALDGGPFARAWRVTLDPLSKALGRTAREQVTTRRDEVATTLQALELANGQALYGVLRRGADALLASGASATPERIFERALLRTPNDGEARLLREIMGADPTTESLSDLLWCIVLHPEFQLIR